ncbi:hypothetical protein MASR2M66_33340 [Chloroflexota bacterium]
MLKINSNIVNTRVPVTVVHVSGAVDSSNYQEFQTYLDGQVEQGARHILLNFKETQHISSAGLRVIHNLFNKLRDLHKDINDDELRRKMSAGKYKSPYLKLANLNPNLVEVFNLGGFDIYIELFEDETKALNSF